MSFRPPGSCPNCGEHVESGAASCENCGSCAKTGWSEETYYDGLDLPDESEGGMETRSDRNLFVTIATVLIFGFLIWVYLVR